MSEVFSTATGLLAGLGRGSSSRSVTPTPRRHSPSISDTSVSQAQPSQPQVNPTSSQHTQDPARHLRAGSSASLGVVGGSAARRSSGSAAMAAQARVAPTPAAPAGPPTAPILADVPVVISREFSTPQDVLIITSARDSEREMDQGFYVNSAVLVASCAWFASCIDDRPPDYEPNAVFRISVDECASDMLVFLRMLHVGSPNVTSMRITLQQVLHDIPRLFHRFGADRTLWRLLPTYLPPPTPEDRSYSLERLGVGFLRDNIWALLVLAHEARDAGVWANTVGLGHGVRPRGPQWAFVWDPYLVDRAEITPARETIYKILLAAARIRSRAGPPDFEYTHNHLIVGTKRVKTYFGLTDEMDNTILS